MKGAKFLTRAKSLLTLELQTVAEFNRNATGSNELFRMSLMIKYDIILIFDISN
jgi:hypothetical protein